MDDMVDVDDNDEEENYEEENGTQSRENENGFDARNLLISQYFNSP